MYSYFILKTKNQIWKCELLYLVRLNSNINQSKSEKKEQFLLYTFVQIAGNNKAGYNKTLIKLQITSMHVQYLNGELENVKEFFFLFQ